MSLGNFEILPLLKFFKLETKQDRKVAEKFVLKIYTYVCLFTKTATPTINHPVS